MAELDIVMKLRAIAHLSPPSISGVTALNPESREAIEAGAHEIERLRAALKDVTGGMRTLGFARDLPGPVSRAEALLPKN